MTDLHATPSALLSVVLPTPDDYGSIRTTVDHLRRQTARKQIELVLVATSEERLRPAHDELGELAAVEVVELGEITSIAAAYAAGVRRATAPIVALAEDHSFPDPDWAVMLIEAHRGPWAAVGPAVRNGNPATAVSWADFYTGYGPWMDPMASGPIEHLPGHNSSYKRERLLAYGPELEARMEAETLLHWELRAQGHELYLEGRAKTSHVNFSLLSSYLRAQYHGGRVFAGTRIENMSPLARALYVVAAPLIPAVRLARIHRQASKPGRSRVRFLRTLPVLMLGLALDGLGQLVGHVAGVGASVERQARFEFNRVEHLSSRDRVVGKSVDGYRGAG